MRLWALSFIASMGIAIPYFAISYFITRGLARTGQLRRNALALGTALIFVSCGMGHLLHAGHLLEAARFRADADLHITVWDLSTAVIACWYLSMRGRYAQLLRGPAMFEDHERAAAETRARHDASHDHLTGLPNRQALMDATERALRPTPSGAARAMLFVDLDGFKAVNDRYGHLAGDALLIAASERLRRAIRANDLVARLGGDEFVILLGGDSTPQQAIAFARRQADALRAPFPVAEEMVTLTVSIGIALATPGEENAAELLHRADIAMYDAKNGGGACYRLHGYACSAAERPESFV